MEDLLRKLVSYDPQERNDAVNALGEIKNPQILPRLIEMLKSHPDYNVRRGAAKALGEIGDAQSATALVLAMADPVGIVGENAENALEKIDPQWRSSMAAKDAVPALLGLLTHQKGHARSQAARNLGIIGDTRALEGLILANIDPDGLVRRAASRAVGEIDESWRSSTAARSALPVLQEATYTGKTKNVRDMAVLLAKQIEKALSGGYV